MRRAGYIQHPVLSVGSFIPEMEDKSQELACQNVLRDFLNLLLNGHAWTSCSCITLGCTFPNVYADRTVSPSTNNPTTHKVLYEFMGNKSMFWRKWGGVQRGSDFFFERLYSSPRDVLAHVFVWIWHFSDSLKRVWIVIFKVQVCWFYSTRRHRCWCFLALDPLLCAQKNY